MGVRWPLSMWGHLDTDTQALTPQRGGEKVHRVQESEPKPQRPCGAPPCGHDARWPGILLEGGSLQARQTPPRLFPHQEGPTTGKPAEPSNDGGPAAEICPHPLHWPDHSRGGSLPQGECLSFSPCTWARLPSFRIAQWGWRAGSETASSLSSANWLRAGVRKGFVLGPRTLHYAQEGRWVFPQTEQPVHDNPLSGLTSSPPTGWAHPRVSESLGSPPTGICSLRSLPGRRGHWAMWWGRWLVPGTWSSVEAGPRDRKSLWVSWGRNLGKGQATAGKSRSRKKVGVGREAKDGILWANPWFSKDGPTPIDATHCGGGGLWNLFQSKTAPLWTGGQRDPQVFGWGRHRGSRRTQWPLGFCPSPASPLKCRLGPWASVSRSLKWNNFSSLCVDHTTHKRQHRTHPKRCQLAKAGSKHRQGLHF